MPLGLNARAIRVCVHISLLTLVAIGSPMKKDITQRIATNISLPHFRLRYSGLLSIIAVTNPSTQPN